MKSTTNISKKTIGIIASICFVVGALASADATSVQHHAVTTPPKSPVVTYTNCSTEEIPSRHITKANRAPMGILILSNSKANLELSKSANQANLAMRIKRQSSHNQSPTLLFAHPNQHHSQFHSPNIIPHTAQEQSAEMAGNLALLAAVLAHTTAA